MIKFYKQGFLKRIHENVIYIALLLLTSWEFGFMFDFE